jgi:predicted dehydrogenase
LKTVFNERDTGDLISIWSRRLCNLYKGLSDQRSWRGDFKKSGGVIAELLTHEIDWMCDIAGKPVEVFARSYAVNRQDPRDNDHLWITYKFASGAHGTIEGSQCAPIGNYSKGIIGTKASVSDRNWGGEAHWESPDGHEELEKVEGFDSFGNWLDAIDGKAEAETDVNWGRDISLIIERTLDSVESGQPVTIEW